jgi:hypothetical protein
MARIFTAFTEKSQRPGAGVGDALAGYASFQLKQRELQQQQARFREEIGLREKQLELSGQQLQAQIDMNKELRSLQREQLDKTLASREKIAGQDLDLRLKGLHETRRASLAKEQEARAARAQAAREGALDRASLESRTDRSAAATEEAARIRVGGAQAAATAEAEKDQAELEARRKAALGGLERSVDVLMRRNDNKPVELRMSQSEYEGHKTALSGLAAALETATTDKEFEDLLSQQTKLIKAIEDSMTQADEARAAAMLNGRVDRNAQAALAAGVPQADIDEVLSNGNYSQEERASVLELRRNGATSLQEAEMAQGQLLAGGTAEGDMYRSFLRGAEQTHVKELKNKGDGIRDLDAVVASFQPGTPNYNNAWKSREFARAYEEYHGAKTQQQEADALRKMMAISRMDDPTMGVLAAREQQANVQQQQAQNSMRTMEYERAALQQLPPGVSVGLSDPATQLAIAYMQEYGDHWSAGQEVGGMRVEGWTDTMTEFAANLEEAVMLYDRLPQMTGAERGPGDGSRPEGFRTTFDYQINYLAENGMTPEDFATLAVTTQQLLSLPPNSHFKRWAAQISELPE